MDGLTLTVGLLLLTGSFSPATIPAGLDTPAAVQATNITINKESPFRVAAALEVAPAISRAGMVSGNSLVAAQAENLLEPLVDEETRFIELANRERIRHRLNTLDVDPVLVQAAREHSRDMYERNYFSHTSPDEAKKTAMRRYLAALGNRPDYAIVGENLFYCSIVDVNRGQHALMNSRYHRENILDARFDKIGVGVYKAPDGTFWVTQMFLSNNP